MSDPTAITPNDDGAVIGPRARVDALRDEHCFITSVDVCSYCGDSECTGMCFGDFDPDEGDQEPLDELHDLLREGQAWRALRAMLDAGEHPVVAVMVAEEALANANNRTVTAMCQDCDEEFLAQGPCDSICTPCRLIAGGYLAPLVTCTGISATWCPIHGDCDGDVEYAGGEHSCPLHAINSPHALGNGRAIAPTKSPENGSSGARPC
jgi:hypothetical protein